MNWRQRRLATATFTLGALVTSVPLAVQAAEAILTVYVSDAGSPKVTYLADGVALQGESLQNPSGTRFRIPLEGKLVSPLLLEVKPTDPTANLFPLRIDAPLSWSNRTYVVRLRPAKVTGNAEEVRQLFSRTISSNNEDLPELYQQARAIAAIRIARLANNWPNLHDYDVQAVFKYLEIVRELNERFIVPGDDVEPYVTWLEDALKQRPSRVDSAVGRPKATQLIGESRQLQGIRFSLLWRYVADARKPCKQRLPILKTFVMEFQELSSDEQRSSVEQVMRVPAGQFLSAIAQCEVVRLRCSEEFDQSEALSTIDRLTEDIDAVEVNTTDSVARSALRSDSATLSNLRSDLQTGAKRTCPDSHQWSMH